MRSYLIDEVLPADIQRVETFLKENAIASGIDGLFWIRFPEELLNDIQHRHADCQPHVFAVELGKNWIRLELLARSLNAMRCECQVYCTSGQIAFVTDFAHKMLDDLHIRT